MNILIIQPHIPEYRIQFFEELAKEIGGFTLLHFGDSRRFENYPLINEVSAGIRKIGGIRIILGLRNIVKEHGVVIVIFDPHWINCFLAPILYPNKKIIYWGHGFGRNKFINRIRLNLLKKAKALITYSQEGAEDFMNNNIEPAKIFVAPNTLWISNHEDLSFHKKNSFLFVGRLQNRKNLKLFLYAFADSIAPLTRECYVNIIGDGEEEKKVLKEFVELFDLENHVNFIEGTTDDKILKMYFSQAYAYVSPGAVGLGVLHSFAYGVPVITMPDENHGPEFENIIHGQNGWICDDNQELRSLLSHLVQNDYEHRWDWNENSAEHKDVLYRIGKLLDELNEEVPEQRKYMINREIEVQRKKLQYMPTKAERLEISRNAYQHYINHRQIEHMVDGFSKAIQFVK